MTAWSHSPFAVEVENHPLRDYGKKFGYGALLTRHPGIPDKAFRTTAVYMPREGEDLVPVNPTAIRSSGRGVNVLRAGITNYATTRADIDRLVELLG